MIPISEDELTEFVAQHLFTRDVKANRDLFATHAGRESKARRLARLMLASEQMYEALKQSQVGLLEGDHNLTPAMMSALDYIKDALAAAEGRNA